MDDGGLALDAAQSRGLGKQLVIEDECSSHMHKYGDFICISQEKEDQSTYITCQTVGRGGPKADTFSFGEG